MDTINTVPLIALKLLMPVLVRPDEQPGILKSGLSSDQNDECRSCKCTSLCSDCDQGIACPGGRMLAQVMDVDVREARFQLSCVQFMCRLQCECAHDAKL